MASLDEKIHFGSFNRYVTLITKWLGGQPTFGPLAYLSLVGSRVMDRRGANHCPFVVTTQLQQPQLHQNANASFFSKNISGISKPNLSWFLIKKKDVYFVSVLKLTFLLLNTIILLNTMQYGKLEAI